MPDRRDAGCSGKAGAASGALFEEVDSGLATSVALSCSHGLGGAGISTQWNANLNQCCRQVGGVRTSFVHVALAAANSYSTHLHLGGHPT